MTRATQCQVGRSELQRAQIQFKSDFLPHYEKQLTAPMDKPWGKYLLDHYLQKTHYCKTHKALFDQQRWRHGSGTLVGSGTENAGIHHL